MARISVPLLGNTLSRPLPVIALVGRYPTNKLIGRRPLTERITPLLQRKAGDHWVLATISRGYPQLSGRYLRVTNPFATSPTCAGLVRLACLIHAASVHPEPGSNSQKNKSINFYKYTEQLQKTD